MSSDPNAAIQTPQQQVEDETLVARRVLPRQILLLLMLLLVVLLIALATGRGMLLGFPGLGTGNTVATVLPISGLGDGSGSSTSARQRPQGSIQTDGIQNLSAVCSPPGAQAELSPRFATFYHQHGGLRIFGYPISSELNLDGRVVQWFERARLEEWPEQAGTAYGIQGARLGVEFTKDIEFPKQTFFVSQPDIRYFAETNQGVREPFLSFWEQNGGLTIFGYPISSEVNEELEDGQLHVVQYFERARLEYHPAQNQTVQVGRLGHALCLEESHPRIIPPARPTTVPLP